MSSYSLAQLSNINWSDMFDKSIKYVDIFRWVILSVEQG